MWCPTVKTFAFLCVSLAGFVLPTAGEAGSKVHVGRRWPAGQQVSMDQIDHTAWSSLLARYVDTGGHVDYQAWKSSSADVRALDDYLASLSRASLSVPAARNGQLAFWINAYNAVTIRGILREYPTSSIRNHTPKLWGYHIWNDLLLSVGNGQYSLSQIEHDVLRKMNDPRIHFAIVCASTSCPKLINQAYTADALEEQLVAGARQFFADRGRFSYDARSKRINLSPILKWYDTDFGPTQAAQLQTIAPYLPDAASQKLAASGAASVSYLSYDWGLNDQARITRSVRR